MPANQGKGGETWNPQPDFQRDYHLLASPQETVVDYNDATAVAEQLRYTDPQLSCYEFMLAEDELQALALDSARQLIEERRTLLLRHESTVPAAQPAVPIRTVYVAMVTCNGQTTGWACEPSLPKRRFG